MSEQNGDQSNSSQQMSMQDHLEQAGKESISLEEWAERVAPHASHNPFRLDLIFDAARNIFIIQGDANGLKALANSILSLAHPAAFIGEHTHFDAMKVRSLNIEELFIQRINTDNDEGIAQHNI